MATQRHCLVNSIERNLLSKSFLIERAIVRALFLLSHPRSFINKRRGLQSVIDGSENVILELLDFLNGLFGFYQMKVKPCDCNGLRRQVLVHVAIFSIELGDINV